VNDTPNHEIMFNDFWGNLSYTVIQPGSGFRDTGNFTQFTPNLTWDTFNGRLYTAFAPNSRTDFLRFAPGG